MDYYVNNNSSKGALNISAFVFSQIGQERLEKLANNELKDSISLKLARNKINVVTTIDKNNVEVAVNFFAVRNSDVQNSVLVVQKEIYDAIYEATEISTVKVNVSVCGFVDNEK